LEVVYYKLDLELLPAEMREVWSN